MIGFLALAVGVSLAVVNWRKNGDIQPGTVLAHAPAISETRIDHPQIDVRPSPNATPSARAVATASPKNTLPQTSPSPIDISAGYVTDSLDAFLTTPSATPTATPEITRCAGDIIVGPRGSTGRGVLSISNNTSFDAIVKVVEGSRTVRAICMQAFSAAEIPNIGTGVYTIKFALGLDYNATNQLFNRPQTFKQFDETFQFREYKTDGYIHWTDFEISLNPVVYGTATAKVIKEQDFRDH